MIHKFLFFLILISQIAVGQGTNLVRTKPFLFVDSLFTKENYIVEFLDFEFPKDIQDILFRFNKSLSEKKEWSEEYISKNYRPGEGLPYHENFGVTKEEYQKIKDIAKSPLILVVKSTSSITAKRTPNFILFKTIDADARYIESVNIDLKNELVIFINDTIPFYKEISASALKAYGNVQGYTWKKEISNLSNKDDFKKDSLISKIVEINFGKIQEGDRILLMVKYNEVNKGQIKAKFEAVCYLK